MDSTLVFRGARWRIGERLAPHARAQRRCAKLCALDLGRLGLGREPLGVGVRKAGGGVADVAGEVAQLEALGLAEADPRGGAELPGELGYAATGPLR